jgi:hypothetical protein
LTGHTDERGRWEPRRNEVESSAKIDGSFVEGQASYGGPEIQRVAVGAASEAVVNLPDEMDGEGSV